MRVLNLTTKIEVYLFSELTDEEKKIVEKAKNATNRAYAPYSEFQVGAAALLENGEIVEGNNQENGAYPSGLCAERVAIFYANSLFPNVPIKTLAIAAQTKGAFTFTPVTPCGACRQVLLETELRYRTPMRVLLYGEEKVYVFTCVKDLLPLHFEL